MSSTQTPFFRSSNSWSFFTLPINCTIFTDVEEVRSVMLKDVMRALPDLVSRDSKSKISPQTVYSPGSGGRSLREMGGSLMSLPYTT